MLVELRIFIIKYNIKYKIFTERNLYELKQTLILMHSISI